MHLYFNSTNFLQKKKFATNILNIPGDLNHKQGSNSQVTLKLTYSPIDVSNFNVKKCKFALFFYG